MPDAPSRFSRFVAELRRRHVVRVAVAYAAATFVLLQAGEIVFEAFDLPSTGLRLMVLLCALGFPLAVVLAWVYEITPHGVRRTALLHPDWEDVTGGGKLLPRVALLAVTVVCVGVAGWWALRTGVSDRGASRDASYPVLRASGEVPGPIRSLAVLPLASYVDTGEPDYFAAGMHEELISQLSRLGSFRVVSRTSVMRYQGAERSIPEIARELGVDAVLEGSVLRAEDRVRVTVQLIHGASDEHMWSNSYEAEFRDIIGLQGRIAQAVATEVQGELSPEQESLVTASALTASGDAQDAYMRGRHRQREGTSEGLRAAIGHYEEAVAADTAFALAHAALASARLHLDAVTDDPPAGLLERAREDAIRAVALDSTSIEGREVLAIVERELASADRAEPPTGGRVAGGGGGAPAAGAGPAADAEPRQAAAGGGAPATGAPAAAGVPGSHVPEAPAGDVRRVVVRTTGGSEVVLDPSVFDWAGFSSEMGRVAQVALVSRMEHAEHLAPLIKVDAARQVALGGHDAQAEKLLREVTAENPGLHAAWDALERMHASHGRYEQVLAVRRERARLPGAGEGERAAAQELERAMAEHGPREGYWRDRLARLEAADDASPVELAAAHAQLGRTAEALALLQRAVAEGDRGLRGLRVDPVWDPLRPGTEFRELLAGIRRGPPAPPRGLPVGPPRNP